MTDPESAWSPAKSAELYGFARWSSGHVDVDDAGRVTMEPWGDGRTICIKDVIDQMVAGGRRTPFVIRFLDLLRHRVDQLNTLFQRAIEEEGYDGRYRGVFPIKANQLRAVVDEIIKAGTEHEYGLEVGSKPELMIALAMHEGTERLIICNGYKDPDYIRLALLGRKLHKPVILVVEQLSEVDHIVAAAQETRTEPLIGLRVKLQTRGEGKWATSTGDSAKFGLNTAEILLATRKLRQADLTDCLRLLHFHIGSQVPDILAIKNAVVEASRFYCQLRKSGFPMGILDVGGGLGIDYDGSRTNFESSMNYSMAEYARDVVANVRDICIGEDVPVPDITSESGRAVVAPHSMLVVEVFERISKQESLSLKQKPRQEHKVVMDLAALAQNEAGLGRLERYHDAVQRKEEAFSLFNLGYLDLENRAAAEALFWQICRDIAHETETSGYVPEELHNLTALLADQYVCNFSVFQSLLDHWALQQLFPIAPLHRLDEKPTVNATLVDITCDSDGKIDRFIDLEETSDHLPLHPLDGKPYYLGIFLTGAYQDIMGDLHNLFGRVNEVNIVLQDSDRHGFQIKETRQGSCIRDVIFGVQHSVPYLTHRLEQQIDAAIRREEIIPQEGMRGLKLYRDLLETTTYLNTERAAERERPDRE